MVNYKELNRFIEQILTGSESLDYISKTLMTKSFGFDDAISDIEIYYNGRFYMGFFIDEDEQSEYVDVMMSDEYNDVHTEILNDMKTKDFICFDLNVETFINEDGFNSILRNSVIVTENDFKVLNKPLLYVQKSHSTH